jgi:hypothetical protein
MNEPTVAGTITMHYGETWVDVDEPPLTPGVYVMDVIRGSGMREGDRMGWAVVTMDDDGMTVSVLPTRAEAVAQWRVQSEAAP